MRTRRLVITGFIVSCLILSGCSKSKNKPGSESFGLTPSVSEEKKITSAGVVKAVPQRAEIDAGHSGEAILRLTIENGYHINAHPPTYPYLKATELMISPAPGVEPGDVKYPPPLLRKFPFADEQLAVYEGQTDLKATITANNSATKGEQSLSAILRIQACDDQVCYPPGSIDLTIPILVK